MKLEFINTGVPAVLPGGQNPAVKTGQMCQSQGRAPLSPVERTVRLDRCVLSSGQEEGCSQGSQEHGAC